MIGRDRESKGRYICVNNNREREREMSDCGFSFFFFVLSHVSISIHFVSQWFKGAKCLWTFQQNSFLSLSLSLVLFPPVWSCSWFYMLFHVYSLRVIRHRCVVRCIALQPLKYVWIWMHMMGWCSFCNKEKWEKIRINDSKWIVWDEELNCYFPSFKHWFIDINKEDRHIQKIDGYSWQNEKFIFFIIKEQKGELEKSRKKQKKLFIFISFFVKVDVCCWMVMIKRLFFIAKIFVEFTKSTYIQSAPGLCII